MVSWESTEKAGPAEPGSGVVKEGFLENVADLKYAALVNSMPSPWVLKTCF